MLMRMYVRWAEQHGYKVEWIEETEGEGAGIKSATVVIKGHNAYGWLKSENGVHRLGRISPFDSNARRHTSFASVGVFPVIDDRIKIDIKESDVRTDVMRSGGAGGQHVNKTESAVRLTHIPTNIVVKCQQDRSQHRNRAMAWDMLRAKLFEMEIKKREAKAEVEQAAKTDIGWGHQIRSYVLQPYQMVKDLRTGVSTSNTGAVLDGELDEFMQAALAQKAFGNGPGQVEDVEEGASRQGPVRRCRQRNCNSIEQGAIIQLGAHVSSHLPRGRTYRRSARLRLRRFLATHRSGARARPTGAPRHYRVERQRAETSVGQP